MTLIATAYLQQSNQGRSEPDLEALAAELTRRGVPVARFREKTLLRGRLPLSPTSFVAGTIPVVQSALRQLGVPVPQPVDYPAALRPWLHRRIWEDTLGEVRNRVYEAAQVAPFFIKPKDQLKRFAGRVVHTWNDLSDTYMVSRYCEVFCAEPVKWRAEFRVFVLRGEVLGIRHYNGNPDLPLDAAVVREAVRTLTETGSSPVAYALDFGVLLDGTTALVEMNDAYALGSYGLDPPLYTNFLLTRWGELMEQAESKHTLPEVRDE